MNFSAHPAIRHPRLTLLVILSISVVFTVVIMSRSRMETDLDKYMPQDHPAFVYSDQAEAWFNIQDTIIIAIENREGIYQTGTFDKIKRLTQALQKMPEIRAEDVTSLYTADNIVGTDDGLDVTPFFKTPPREAEMLQRIREAVKGNDMVNGRLVSFDETVTVIIAGIKDDVFSQDFYHRILTMVKDFEGPETLHVAGRPIVEGTMAYLSPKDMQRMVPIVILVIVIVLLTITSSFKSTLWTLLVVVISTIWTFGLMAAVSIPIYAVSTMIPVMLIAIGVADGIHLFNHLQLHLQHHPETDRKSATRGMLEELWKPVVMTSVTTAVGFVSLMSSQVYPIKYFGIFTAFGVMSAMLLSLVLIPAGIMAFDLPGWKRKIAKSSKTAAPIFSYWFADRVMKHQRPVIATTLIVVALSVSGIGRVWIDSSFLDKFEKDSEIVLTDQFINAHFGGTSTLNVILEATDEGTFKHPDVLKLIDRVQTEIEKLPEVGNSFSLADYLKRMNKVMHADEQTWNLVPESDELIAQYLLLYEMSGDPANLLKLVDYPYRRANLTFQLNSDTSIALNRAIEAVESHRSAFQKMGIEVRYAGAGYKALVFTDLILEGQLISLLMSIALIVLLLSVMFRNLRVGLIGSIPILITAAISFGLMGLLAIPLSTTTALISSIAVGIGIDYAVHFIERYRLSAQTSADPQQTIRQTMHHSGRAITFNALVVIAGFLVLLASVFPPNRVLGALVSLNMFISFLGTVSIMAIFLLRSRVFLPPKTDLTVNPHVQPNSEPSVGQFDNQP